MLLIKSLYKFCDLSKFFAPGPYHTRAKAKMFSCLSHNYFCKNIDVNQCSLRVEWSVFSKNELMNRFSILTKEFDRNNVINLKFVKNFEHPKENFRILILFRGEFNIFKTLLYMNMLEVEGRGSYSTSLPPYDDIQANSNRGSTTFQIRLADILWRLKYRKFYTGCILL